LQVADWKIHKKTCNGLASGNNESRSAIKTSHTAMWAFIKSNYFAIAKEVYKKTQEYNVPKKELFLEVDFDGDSPALQNEFKVWSTPGFLEGPSLVGSPDCLRKTVRSEYEKVTNDDLLVVCRSSNGMVTVQSLRLPVANASDQLLSDEAVESIGREDCSDGRMPWATTHE
jgi:hypothetical protein